jgi:dTDP-4-dehydrorhamnose reductase
MGPLRIAVTGAGGRLGRALLAALSQGGVADDLVAWSRPDYDLEDPDAPRRLLRRHRPRLVVHAAAWTDVDGCARDPHRALVRNGLATAALAAACARAGVSLIYVSTNEVFAGDRGDGQGYQPEDPPHPVTPYGRSKEYGEAAATAAFVSLAGVEPPQPYDPDRSPPAVQLAIVRTAWLFGPPGGDFPSKILAAARQAQERGTALRVVADEVGSPTYSRDLACALAALIASGRFHGIHHIVNGGRVSRAGWARWLLSRLRLEVPLEEVGQADWPRPARPPAWAVLATTPLPRPPLRSWEAAMEAYLAVLASSQIAAVRG